MPPNKEQRNPIVAEPTKETLAYAKKYQEKMAKIRAEQEAKRQARAKEDLKAERARREEEIKNRPTARELSETPEFQAWCQEHLGIAPTKRAAANHRAEYEKFQAQQKEAVEMEQKAA